MLLLGALSSCVDIIDAKNESRKSINALTSTMLLETSCLPTKSSESAIVNKVKDTFNAFQNNHPHLFIDTITLSYTQSSAMVIGPKIMEEKLNDLTLQYNDDSYRVENLRAIGYKLYILYVETLRYEGQSCIKEQLAKSESTDIRKYYNVEKWCTDQKIGSDCSVNDEILLKDKEQFTKFYLDICSSLGKKAHQCAVEYVILEKKKLLAESFKSNLVEFKKLRIDNLFSLNHDHLKFRCEQNSSEIEMHLDVYSASLSLENQQEILKYVEDQWSNDRFKLRLNIVNYKDEKTIEIKLTDRPISYVKKNDHKTIYLSKRVYGREQKQILAHEFGHVLGFPDCYIEFFNKSTNTLTYYEADNSDNLMCSVNLNNKIPHLYLEELVKKSCLF